MVRMLHASVVVCGFFALTRAIRTDFKSSEDTVLGVGMVLQKIRTLLPEDLQASTVFMQVMGGLQSKSETAPGNLKSVLKSTIDDIVTVTQKHKSDHDQTAGELVSKFNAMNLSVTSTIAEKARVKPPCDTALAASRFAWNEKNRVNFACSLDVNGKCDTHMEDFNARLGQVRTSLERSLAAAVTNFNTKTDSCVAAKCVFGKALQTQCGQASEYKSGVAVLSNALHARRTEWKSATVISCLLHGVVEETGDLTTADLQDCTTKLNYNGDVGQLDLALWHNKLQDLLDTTDACGSTTIFSEAFTSADGQPPFAQCSST